jgi:tetratricopeptide (TPR) repeat protein
MRRGVLRVFLSHTSELRTYPSDGSFVAAAEEAVKLAGGAILDMKYFPAADKDPGAYCRERLKDADVYVGIIGFRYGTQVPGNSQQSYTQLEFQTATDLKVPRLVFLLGDDAQGPRDLFIDQENGKKQEAFRARLENESGLVIQKIKTPDLLTTKLLQALKELDHRSMPSPALPVPAVDISYLPSASHSFVGRNDEVALALDAADNASTNVISITGVAGTGKTALINELVRRLADAAPREIVAWSFDASGIGRGEERSADAAVDYLCGRIGESLPLGLDALEQGRRLSLILQERPTVLIMDGIEKVQNTTASRFGTLTHPAMYALLRNLAYSNAGVCLVTSRLPVTDLDEFPPPGHIHIELGPLQPEAAIDLVRRLGLSGTDYELRSFCSDYDFHPLTITLVASAVAQLFDGDISQRAEIPFLAGDGLRDKLREIVEWYERSVTDPIARAVLRSLGFFPYGGSVSDLTHLLGSAVAPQVAPDVSRHLTRADVRGGIAQLERLQIVNVRPGGGLDAHPLVREVLQENLRATLPGAWVSGHRHLFNVGAADLSTTPLPLALADMAPLFRLLYHGCEGSKVDRALTEVYLPCIARGDADYCMQVLGAVSSDLYALRNFFVTEWTLLRPGVPEDLQAWIMHKAAFDLRALGRLEEAREAVELALALAESRNDWAMAAQASNNRARSALMLGRISEAVEAGRRAVSYADRSDDHFRQAAYRSNLGHYLAQAGMREEAGEEFAKSAALEDQLTQEGGAKRGDIRKNQYWDFLLWDGRRDEVLSEVRAVLPHTGGRLIDVALDYLSLTSALLAANDPSGEELREAGDAVSEGVGLVRSAGRMYEVPRALVLRAAWQTAVGDVRASRASLDEAIQLAVQFHFRLHHADALLQLARTERREGNAEAAHQAAGMAVGIIDACSYRRRSDELAALLA